MSNERPSDQIEGLPSPLSEMPWSASFVMQAIEILPVALEQGHLLSLQPEHADSFVIGWPVGRKPVEVAAGALRQLGIAPIVLHSTSWRHVGTEVVLTYIAVVSGGGKVPPSWRATSVGRTELARGEATAPPTSIGVLQVLEHALRHLAWLVRDDPAIAQALPEWPAILVGYVPEPFRAFGGPASQP